MPLENDAVETLTLAGLTVLQAKVYFALVRAGKADIKTISQHARLDRSNAYKTVESLQKLALVEKIIGLPHSYVAIPIEYCLKTLLEKKEQEYILLKTKSKKLIEKYAAATKPYPDEEYIKILPGKDAFIKKWEETLKAIENSVDLIVTEKREPGVYREY